MLNFYARLKALFDFKSIQRFADHKTYMVLLAGLAALDLIILLIPIDVILVSSILITPKKWISRSLSIAVGSTFGAALIAIAVSYFGEQQLAHWLGDRIGLEHWSKLTQLMKSHSFLAVFLFGAGPVPLQPGVILASIQSVQLPEIIGATFAGRAVKYLLFGWVASHAPHHFKKFKFMEVSTVKIPQDLSPKKK